MPMPRLISYISQRIVQSIPWGPSLALTSTSASKSNSTPNSNSSNSSWWADSYQAEAGVVNFYQYRDSLTAHIDQSEVDIIRPLISLSLGEAAIFLIGGKTRAEKPMPIMLRSGDALVMSDASRRLFHGIPRIVECQMDAAILDSASWEGIQNGDKIRDYLRGTRVNVNVRQVFSGD